MVLVVRKDDMRESGSFVVRLKDLFFSILLYFTTLGLLITDCTIHNNSYLLTESIVSTGCENRHRSAPDGSELKNVFEKPS